MDERESLESVGWRFSDFVFLYIVFLQSGNSRPKVLLVESSSRHSRVILKAKECTTKTVIGVEGAWLNIFYVVLMTESPRIPEQSVGHEWRHRTTQQHTSRCVHSQPHSLGWWQFIKKESRLRICFLLFDYQRLELALQTLLIITIPLPEKAKSSWTNTRASDAKVHWYCDFKHNYGHGGD